MPGTTPIYGITYPVATDAPSASGIETVARDVEDALAARTFVRFTGQTERAADGGTLTLPADTRLAVVSIVTTVVNNQAVVHAHWYGFTLSGAEPTRVLVSIRRVDSDGPTLAAVWTPDIPPSAGPVGGGSLTAFDPTPGVNPRYTLAMTRASATVGVLRLVPGSTSPYAVIIAEQKGTVK